MGGWEQGDFLLCIAFAFEFQIMCIYYYSKILSNQRRKERREHGESKRNRDRERDGEREDGGEEWREQEGEEGEREILSGNCSKEIIPQTKMIYSRK